jgi:hypothetical protein
LGLADYDYQIHNHNISFDELSCHFDYFLPVLGLLAGDLDISSPTPGIATEQTSDSEAAENSDVYMTALCDNGSDIMPQSTSNISIVISEPRDSEPQSGQDLSYVLPRPCITISENGDYDVFYPASPMMVTSEDKVMEDADGIFPLTPLSSVSSFGSLRSAPSQGQLALDGKAQSDVRSVSSSLFCSETSSSLSSNGCPPSSMTDFSCSSFQSPCPDCVNLNFQGPAFIFPGQHDDNFALHVDKSVSCAQEDDKSKMSFIQQLLMAPRVDKL